MTENLPQFLLSFFRKKMAIFWLFIVLFTAGLIYGALKLDINQDVYGVLPEGEELKSLKTLTESKGLNDQVYFLINLDSSNSEFEINDLLQEAHQAIEISSDGCLKNITSFKDDVVTDVYDYYLANFPTLIDSSYYANMDSKIPEDSVTQALTNTYNTLIGMSGAFSKSHLLHDPIGISSSFFNSLSSTYDSEQIKVEDGIIFNKDKSGCYLYGTLNCTDTDKQEALYVSLNLFKATWNKTHPNNPIDYFGTFQIFVENSTQVKKDTILTVSITIVAILLILLLYYRKLIIPLIFILPTAYSILFAVGMMGYLHPHISGLAMATGAILFGIVLDYSFHFYTHLKHTGNISQTLKEITSPLLTGNITTVLAFGALMFANSKILQDFGLFAALALVGAVIFILFILPAILSLLPINFSELGGKERNINIPNIPKKYYPITLILLVIVTGVCWVGSKQISFDSDLSNMSYHSDDLKEKENQFVGINPDQQTKLFVFAEGSNYEEALASNYQLFQSLKSQKASHVVKQFNNVGDFLIPAKAARQRLKTWESYWENKSTPVFEVLDNKGQQLGFRNNSFDTFKAWITDTTVTPIDSNLLTALELHHLIDTKKSGQTTFISTVIIDKSNVADFIANVESIAGVSVFSKANAITALLSSVKDDFNYLFLVSALIVFITLLLIYGRIELALLSFLPMTISWVIILGIAGFFGIQFNFINVVIATFIFGLGDDFSIFMTDGSLAKYRWKKNSLESYKPAILLSATTTIIGTGVLIFAKHPAIQSIALISVVGLMCILLVSLFIQPILFNIFIQSRVDKGQTPLTLFLVGMSAFIFFVFWLGCLIPTIVLLFLLVTPFNKKFKQRVVTFILSQFGKFQVFVCFHVRTIKEGMHHLRPHTPSVIIANHSSFIDILFIIMLHPKIVIVVKDWVYHSPVFGPLIRYAGYLRAGDGPEENLAKAKALIENGYSIAIFPEGSRSSDGNMKRFHKGAFLLAQELNTPITPVLIHGAAFCLSKGDFIIKRTTVSMKVLPPIENTDLSWGETYGQRTKSITAHYKKAFHDYAQICETPAYLYRKVKQNFVFKKPFLEWQLKKQWSKLAPCLPILNQLLLEHESVSMCCHNYGLEAYYLRYLYPKKQINIWLRNPDKFEISNNGFDKGDSLHVNLLTTETTDFGNPSAHYFDVNLDLSLDEWELLIKKSILALDGKGLLLLTDSNISYLKHADKKSAILALLTNLLDKSGMTMHHSQEKQSNIYYWKN